LRGFLLVSSLLATGSPGTAAAAPPAEDATGWSRTLFKQGEALANGGRWKEACPFFQAAHELHATGGTALRAADCYEKITSYERARGMYRWVVDHASSDALPERVKLAAGRVEALDKQLRAEASPPPAAPTSPPPPPAPPSRVPSIIAFSIGGAGAVLGGVLGGVALAQAGGVKADASVRCPDKACSDPDLASRKSSAVTSAWVANVGIGVAVVGAAVGTVLLFVRTDKAKSTSASVIRALGPGGLTLRF
jgi:hypothetical protein